MVYYNKRKGNRTHKQRGYNYLIKTYGPLHFLYPVMMLIYAGMIGGYLVYAIKGKKACIGYLVDFIDRTLEKKYYNTIEEYNVSLEKQVSEKTAHILHIKDMMVLGMADMVESRDSNTGGHIKRTSGVIKVFSDKLKSYSDKLHIDEAFSYDEAFFL